MDDWWTSTIAGMAPTAAFFDLDKTIIAKSSTFAFSKPFQAGGLISRRAVLRSRLRPVCLPTWAALITTRWSACGSTSSRCAPAGRLQQVREIVAETPRGLIDPIVYDEAVQI